MKNRVVGFVVILVVIIFLGVFFLVFADRGNGSNKKINLSIDCDGIDVSGEYKKGDSFKCELLGDEFVIKIDKVSKDVVYFKADKYGLFPKRSDGTISLIDNVDEFKLEKDKELVLAYQATDTNNEIVINWK